MIAALVGVATALYELTVGGLIVAVLVASAGWIRRGLLGERSTSTENMGG